MIALKDFIYAFTFAAGKHKSQLRKGEQNIPYINHPIEVTNLLSETVGTDDLVLLTAAILHDTLEDTNTSLSEIDSYFGREVLTIIQEVTDDMMLHKSSRKAKQIENAHNLSKRAKLIRVADKTCNVLDIVKTKYHWSNAQKRNYVKWSMQVVERCKGINKKLDKAFTDAVNQANETLGNS
jgi:guanosine-3',5'-bis(diphosphate) 3'-pyrophosphohydrolase